ncbi:MAG: hypothetical protein ACREQI_03265 [Candidatus Binataceae bacterium]
MLPKEFLESDVLWWAAWKQAMDAAIRTGDKETAGKLTFELDMRNLTKDIYPDEHFNFLCMLIRDDSFPESKASAEVISHFLLFYIEEKN